MEYASFRLSPWGRRSEREWGPCVWLGPSFLESPVCKLFFGKGDTNNTLCFYLVLFEGLGRPQVLLVGCIVLGQVTVAGLEDYTTDPLAEDCEVVTVTGCGLWLGLSRSSSVLTSQYYQYFDP